MAIRQHRMPVNWIILDQKEPLLHGATLLHTTATEEPLPWRDEGYSQFATQAEAHYDSRSRPGWSSNPSERYGRCDDKYRDISESEDSDDSATPRREGIRTRQLETLAKDIDRFNPDSHGDRYYALCEALREEYSLFTDQASATLGAFAVMQRKNEPPREY
ncbi:unnamed protein product [Pleuronectes platessa]|uniref:Uncharacterized protein n=1 Tax=Pleuronectes platessa TaxID=8262 RepID=A0A9N7UHQ4_PLEPL|nr:unnamed protein product [Pleuronectes platessa]